MFGKRYRKFRSRRNKVAALCIPGHMMIFLFMMTIGLSAQVQTDSTYFVTRIEKGQLSQNTTGWGLFYVGGHDIVESNHGPFHHPNCRHYQCTANRNAQYIKDTTTIKNKGYRIIAPFDVYIE